MTDEQRRILDAAINGDKALTKYNTLFGPDGPLMARQATLQTEIAKTNSYVLGQMRNLGFREQTLHDLHTLEGRARAISKIVHEYAMDISDEELAHKVAFNKSDFNHGSIDQIKLNAQKVYDATAGPVVTAMATAGYHITPADVGALNTAITNLTADQGLPKVDIATVKAATTGLKLEVKEKLHPAMDSIIDYLSPYALTNLDEYNAVVDSFEIMEIGIRHLSLRVRVSDEETHTRGSRGIVNISGPGIEPGKPISKKISKLGIADFSHEQLPAEGDYTVTVIMDGYEDKVFDRVAVFSDKMTLLDCQMKRK